MGVGCAVVWHGCVVCCIMMCCGVCCSMEWLWGVLYYCMVLWCAVFWCVVVTFYFPVFTCLGRWLWSTGLTQTHWKYKYDWNMDFKFYTAQFTLHSTYYTLHTEHCTIYTTHLILSIKTKQTANCIVYRDSWKICLFVYNKNRWLLNMWVLLIS